MSLQERISLETGVHTLVQPAHNAKPLSRRSRTGSGLTASQAPRPSADVSLRSVRARFADMRGPYQQPGSRDLLRKSPVKRAKHGAWFEAPNASTECRGRFVATCLRGDWLTARADPGGLPRRVLANL